MDQQLTISLRNQFQQALHDFGAKMVASSLRKPYQILINEVRLDYDRNKLGLVTAIDLLKVLGPKLARPIFDTIADHLGFVILPKEDASLTLKNIELLMIQLGAETGDVQRVYIEATSANSEGGTNLSAAEMARIRKELGDVHTIVKTLSGA